jgi:hypothetical protein
MIFVLAGLWTPGETKPCERRTQFGQQTSRLGSEVIRRVGTDGTSSDADEQGLVLVRGRGRIDRGSRASPAAAKAGASSVSADGSVSKGAALASDASNAASGASANNRESSA